VVATVVETKNLLETVAASLIAGVGVTAAFSFVVLGIARSSDMVRNERPALAVAAGGLAVIAGLVVVAAIVFGIVVMTSK
jgi:cytochrome c biogenesis protein CcdA